MAEELNGTEDELAALKRWWGENWKAVLAGIALALVILAVWFGIPKLKEMKIDAAATAYNNDFLTLLQPPEEGETINYDQVITTGEKLIEEHDGTIYASNVAYELARVYYEEKNDPAASIEKLRWVVEDGHDQLHADATMRLALVLIDQNQAAEAKELMSEDAPIGAEAAWLDVRGDALNALGENEAAKQAYQQAIDAGALNADWIQTKLNNVGLELTGGSVDPTPSEASNAESQPAADDSVATPAVSQENSETALETATDAAPETAVEVAPESAPELASESENSDADAADSNAAMSDEAVASESENDAVTEPAADTEVEAVESEEAAPVAE